MSAWTYCLSRQSLLVCRSRIALNLGQRLMSCNRCDLACRAPRFGEAPRGRLPKAMRFAAFGQSGLADRPRDKLPGVIDTLIAAVRAGELDEMFTQASKQRLMPTARKSA
jgi:hypothetical protein